MISVNIWASPPLCVVAIVVIWISSHTAYSQSATESGSVSFSDYSPPIKPVSISPPPSTVAPLTRDRYSGVPIANMDIGYEVIRSRRNLAPKKGELAPDFDLSMADGENRYRLYELCQEKPVVLIFGSWGCDIFRETLAGWQELYDKYHEQAQFVFVYIREAHPIEYVNARPLGRANDPKTLEQRKETARACQKQLRLPFLMLVDEIDDPCAVRWGAWPVRTFMIETDLTVSYAGSQGPWGFRPYRGYVHGSGKQHEEDAGYDWETLEEHLERKFVTDSTRQESASNQIPVSR